MRPHPGYTRKSAPHLPALRIPRRRGGCESHRYDRCRRDRLLAQRPGAPRKRAADRPRLDRPRRAPRRRRQLPQARAGMPRSTTSRAGSDCSRSSWPARGRTPACGRGRELRWRCSTGSSACSPGPRRPTTRSRTVPQATTSPASSPCSAASSCSGSGSERSGGAGNGDDSRRRRYLRRGLVLAGVVLLIGFVLFPMSIAYVRTPHGRPDPESRCGARGRHLRRRGSGSRAGSSPRGTGDRDRLPRRRSTRACS